MFSLPSLYVYVELHAALQLPHNVEETYPLAIVLIGTSCGPIEESLA